ncbi:MAG: hypothetical protein ACE5QV_05540, partial [Fidelibacterota bacterium]
MSGQLWSSALWDVWNDPEVGKRVMDILVLEHHFMLGPEALMEDAARAVVKADVNIFNGEHVQNLLYWFDKRGFIKKEEFRPEIVHTPHHDVEELYGPYKVKALIHKGGAELDRAALWLIYWFNDEVNPDTLGLESTGIKDEYAALINGLGEETLINYYIFAADSNKLAAAHPEGAPLEYHSFRVGPDTIAPEIVHSPLGDFPYFQWPPLLEAFAKDNLGVDSVWVEYKINDLPANIFTLIKGGEENIFSAFFKIERSQIKPGDFIYYRIFASDSSFRGNVSVSPATDYHSFAVKENMGYVLVVDDGSKALNSPISESSNLFSKYLSNMGFDVTVVGTDRVDPSDFQNYDLIISSSGNNTDPVSSIEYRKALEDYVEKGGKLLIEGGELGYAAAASPGYPSFALNVLHTDRWNGDDAGDLNLANRLYRHTLRSIPNELPPVIEFRSRMWGDQDAQNLTGGAFILYEAGNFRENAGISVFDNNSNPMSAQIIYFAFNFSSIEDSLKAFILLENCVNYLLTPEKPPMGVVKGFVDLTDTQFDSGAAVTIEGLTEDRTLTREDGAYIFSALYPGNYTLTAYKRGYFPYPVIESDIHVENDTVSGINFILEPVRPFTIKGYAALADTTDFGGVIVSIPEQNISDTTGSDGLYLLQYVLPGHMRITAGKSGYKSAHLDTSIGNTGETVTVNFNLIPGSDYFFSDFEANVGGFSSPMGWEWGDPHSGPAFAHSGEKLIGTNLNGNYWDNSSWYVESQQIDLSGYSEAALSFWHWYDVEPFYDGGNVKISGDGGYSWKIIYPVYGYPEDAVAPENAGLPFEPAFSGSSMKMWRYEIFDLREYLGKKIKIRFHFGSDGSINYSGWYVDDVRIENRFPALPPANIFAGNAFSGFVPLRWEPPDEWRKFKASSRPSAWKPSHGTEKLRVLTYPQLLEPAYEVNGLDAASHQRENDFQELKKYRSRKEFEDKKRVIPVLHELEFSPEHSNSYSPHNFSAPSKSGTLTGY